MYQGDSWETLFYSRSLGIYGDATPRYVPPHQRQSQNTQKKGNERLRKQVKGLLNRYVCKLSVVRGYVVRS